MGTTSATGKAVRMERLSRYGDGRYVFVPLDHSVSGGPIASAAGVERLVHQVCAGGADGIVVHRGRAAVVAPLLRGRHALTVHLSASTAQAPDTDAKVLVGGVEDAVMLGADAVSVHINVGATTECEQLRDLGAVASACDRWGMPLIVMSYPRGPRVPEPHDPSLVAHAVAVATDLGADLVKTVLTQPEEAMAEVTASTHLPVVAAGGAVGDAGPEALAYSAVRTGCAGLAAGRRVFRAADPESVVRTMTSIVHGVDPSAVDLSFDEMVGVS